MRITGVPEVILMYTRILCNTKLDSVQRIGKKRPQNLYYLEKKKRAHEGIYVKFSKDIREKHS